MSAWIWDTIVVGGDPAGLDAALVLGRCRRRSALVLDDGKPRNASSRALHRCDGWKVCDQPLAAHGRGDDKGGGLARELTLHEELA